jgi:hypothetical protein
MQESFIKLLIASIFAFVYVEALAWLRYKGKISRFLVSLAIGVGCGVIMIWWHGDIRIFPFSLCFTIPGSLLGVMLAEWVWSINQTEQQK